MQRSVCTPLVEGTPVPAGGESWSRLSLCLFCLGCDRTITMGAAAQEEKSGRSVVPGTSRLCASEPTTIGSPRDKWVIGPRGCPSVEEQSFLDQTLVRADVFSRCEH
ncbi:hypothetical protein DPMN_118253 [Dreissena polymorpha]|uniref:Uncharacterized protein n=1 Tax=Dreissena polymorpha TaxID=45954 RepID=A0A9D4GH18_DREPO|nr:hypothetical protein DPMN_118253 [Dreissena polymorpha]